MEEMGARPSQLLGLLDETSFAAQDVIALILGDKLVAYNDATPEQAKRLPPWAKKLNLRLHALGAVDTQTQADGKRRYGFLLGKDPLLLRKAAQAWRKTPHSADRHMLVGKLLGYPDCCSTAYKRMNQMMKTDPRTDLVPLIAGSCGAGPFSFLLNNLMTFNSRLCFSEAAKKIERLYQANQDPALPLMLKSVITWHPCSYRCAPSLLLARRTWGVLKRIAPREASLLKARLSHPVLFLDAMEFAALEGPANRSTARYSRIVPPRSLLKKSSLTLLENGDNVRLAVGGVEVRRGTRRLGFLRAANPLILPFAPRL